MRQALAAAACLLAGCQGGLTTAEIDVPHIGVLLPEQEFPATDPWDPTNFCDPSLPVPQPFPLCVAKALDYDLGAEVPALMNESVEYDLRMTEVAITLSAVSAGEDLSGVESARVMVRNLATGADVVVASYARAPGATPPISSIAVTGNAGVDIGPYLDAGLLPVHVELVMSGAMPAFFADVYAGFSLVVRVDWGTYL